LPATIDYFYSTGRGGLFSVCKPCWLRKSKEYAVAHPEGARARARKQYEANREQVLARSRERYAAKKDTILAQHKKWRAEHPGYWKKNWEADPDRVRTKNANRRAKSRSAAGEFTQEDVAAQHERQTGKCFYCGTKLNGSWHVDHVVPLVLGGTNHPENIVVACPKCNLAKNAKHPMDFAGILF
jgi:5-methylcytosine-specific restriction endonuclease McrA